MDNPFILYNRYYSPITEGINGFFINHNSKQYISIYESYYNRVRAFEYLFLSYKKQQVKLIELKKLYISSSETKETKEIKEIKTINNNIIKKWEMINNELLKIVWLNNILQKINKKNPKPIYKSHNNSLCKAIYNNEKQEWSLSINYDIIKLRKPEICTF